MTNGRNVRPHSKRADIKEGLDFLVEHLSTWQVRSLAAPLLGCGYGGLDWAEVQALIEAKLGCCGAANPTIGYAERCSDRINF